MTPTMQNHVRPRVMWIPLVLVGSVLYWTLALGLGGMSLSMLGGSSQEDLALQPMTLTEATVTPEPVSDHDRETAIPVRLESMSELRGTGGNQTDDGTGCLPGTQEPPAEDSVGRTSF
jgi:hypothetical protein